MELKGKHVAILGAGGSGYAAASLALSRGALVEVFDSGAPGKLVASVARFSDLGAPLTVGDEALAPPRHYDLTVISPGIDTIWPIAVAFSAASDELIGEIEFAFRLGSAPVIAITGTNGKTTTTSLVTTVLNACGLRAVSAGNIGLAYSEVVLSEREYDWIVLEVSSFQLETVSSFSPKIAVWMNFAPDHMDRYRSVDDYFAAKFRIFENLAPGAISIFKKECELSLPGPGVTFSAFNPGADFGYADGMVRHWKSGREFPFSTGSLHGKHNAENVMVALAVADILGLGWDQVTPAILSFQAPPHRCEKVATVNGVTYLNDSKSTNLHSLESALSGQDEPVILIVGGKNKGLDFRELRQVAGRMAREVVCIGEIARDIATAWDGVASCHFAPDVNEAVLMAKHLARPGEKVLFSPGTSSFDMFSGYEARGEAFRSAVRAL